MADKFNSASRIADVLLNARSQDESIGVVKAWSRVFGIEERNDLQETHKVIQGLSLLLSEVELLKAQVASETYGRPDRYASTFALIDAAVNQVNFGAQWSANKNNLLRLDFDMLWLLSDLIPDEARVDEEAISEFVEELKEFKEYAVNNLEGEFRAFVLEQIGIIERAIRYYPIVGVKAFREGTAESVANLIKNQDLYQDDDNAEAKGRLKEIIRKFASFAPKSVLWGAQLVNAADTIREITSG